jgi:hypothetical protein
MGGISYSTVHRYRERMRSDMTRHIMPVKSGNNQSHTDGHNPPKLHYHYGSVHSSLTH